MPGARSRRGRRASPSGCTPRPTCVPPRSCSSAGGSRFCLTGRFGTAEIGLPLLGRLQRGERARRGGVRARPRASAWPRWPSASRGAPQVPGPDGADLRYAVRRAPRLRPHAGRARAGARRRCGPSRRGGSSWCSAAAETGTAASGRSWAPIAGRARRPRHRHLGQSPHRGSRGDHRRHRAGNGRRCRICGSWTGWRRSTPRWTRDARATRSCSPARVTRPTR